jgi:hypothetical protein
MNKADIVDVLTAVRAGDNRTVGQGDVEMWFQVIGDLPKDLSIKAVVEHRKTSPGVWLEPGHINQIVHGIMRETAQRDDYPITSVTDPDAGVGIDERVLSTGKKLYRFFFEDALVSTCGRWRETRVEAEEDGTNFQGGNA